MQTEQINFTIEDGRGMYRVVDLDTGGLVTTNTKREAYKYAALYKAWGHNFRLEIISKEGGQ